jgi:hypothetical protein
VPGAGSRARLQPFPHPPHLKRTESGANPARQQEGKTMEIAAIMMLAAVVFGVAQQFDPPVW